MLRARGVRWPGLRCLKSCCEGLVGSGEEITYNAGISRLGLVLSRWSVRMLEDHLTCVFHASLCPESISTLRLHARRLRCLCAGVLARVVRWSWEVGMQGRGVRGQRVWWDGWVL